MLHARTEQQQWGAARVSVIASRQHRNKQARKKARQSTNNLICMEAISTRSVIMGQNDAPSYSTPLLFYEHRVVGVVNAVRLPCSENS
jgi:hypothetical protein